MFAAAAWQARRSRWALPLTLVAAASVAGIFASVSRAAILALLGTVAIFAVRGLWVQTNRRRVQRAAVWVGMMAAGAVLAGITVGGQSFQDALKERAGHLGELGS